ncbi:MAG: hypothetical protein ACE5JB_02390 [bacterium]
MKTKSTTTFIILSALVIGIVIGVLGSSTWRNKREHTFERMLPHQRFFSFMERVIQPTDEQRAAFEKILAKRSKQLRELYEKHENQVIAIYDSLHTDLNSLLTEEQRNRFEAQLVKGGDKIVERGIARLTEALDLDENQQEQLKQIMNSIKAFPRLDRQNFQGKWEERRNHFQKLQQEIENILTPEQLEKFREMRYYERPPFGRPFRGPRPQRNFRDSKPKRDLKN